MRLLIALVVTAVSGFIALSYEVLWVRIFQFQSGGAPETFGLVLAAYLAGIAAGSLIARLFCRPGERPIEGEDERPRDRDRQLQVVGLFLLAANVAAFLLVPLLAELSRRPGHDPSVSRLLIVVVTALLGTGLPLVAHFAIPPDALAGARLSYLYVANILGSALGSLTTGFVLLDLLPLRALAPALAVTGVVASGILAIAPMTGGRRQLAIGGVAIATALVVVSAAPLYAGVYEKLFWKSDYSSDFRFAHVYEGKSGIVTVTESGIVYGDGSYDGQYDTDPVPRENDNRILRAYAIPLFHAEPKEILMIGLGSGSWLQVLVNDPDVGKVTVVEINPGYVEMMKHQPVVASSLEHPKSEIVIDDGRRFLRRTDRRYDVIVQNTIGYWRSHATNLLSREYFELSRSRLREGGVLYVNSTSSAAVQKTAANAFPNALRYQNMIIASESPLRLDRERWRLKMAQWTIDGRPVTDLSSTGEAIEGELFGAEWRGAPTWEDRDAILERTLDQPLITDDNMATEWYAWEVYPPGS